MEQTGRPIGHIDLAVVRAGEVVLRNALEQAIVPGAIIVVDAVDEDDLEIVAGAIAGAKTRLLLAGSAGLATWLPRAWSLAPRPSTQQPQHAATPLLFVLGSPNPRTQAQITLLRRQVAVIEVEPGTMLEQASESSRWAMALLEQGLDVALVLASRDVRIQTIAPERQQVVAQHLAAIAGSIMEQGTPGSLILGGGDIAFAVCRELGIHSIVLDGEAAPGIPLGTAVTATGNRLRIVTKAGGFGEQDALLAARDLLHGRREPA
jgi:D-threonate/D-erythronate kinase